VRTRIFRATRLCMYLPSWVSWVDRFDLCHKVYFLSRTIYSITLCERSAQPRVKEGFRTHMYEDTSMLIDNTDTAPLDMDMDMGSNDLGIKFPSFSQARTRGRSCKVPPLMPPTTSSASSLLPSTVLFDYSKSDPHLTPSPKVVIHGIVEGKAWFMVRMSDLEFRIEVGQTGTILAPFPSCIALIAETSE